MDKEPLYDEQIRPLVDQIFDRCKELGIPFIASFQVSEEVLTGACYLTGGVADQLRLVSLILDGKVSIEVVPVHVGKQPVKLHD